MGVTNQPPSPEAAQEAAEQATGNLELTDLQQEVVDDQIAAAAENSANSLQFVETLRDFVRNQLSFLAPYLDSILSFFGMAPAAQAAPSQSGSAETPAEAGVRVYSIEGAQVLNEAELSTVNPPITSTERQYLTTLADLGVKPLKILEACPSGVDRATFLEIASYSAEACDFFNKDLTIWFPMLLAVCEVESNFRKNIVAHTGATGAFQHMPRYLSARAQRLRELGVTGVTNNLSGTREQTFAALYFLNSNQSYIDAENPVQYGLNRFASHLYLTYNSGPAVGWVAEIGGLEFSPAQVQELVSLSEAQRVARYGSRARIFPQHAKDRLANPNHERRSFNKCQAAFNRYYQIFS